METKYNHIIVIIRSRKGESVKLDDEPSLGLCELMLKFCHLNLQLQDSIIPAFAFLRQLVVLKQGSIKYGEIPD